VKPGTLPQRLDTVRAEVLAQLLGYNRLTGLNSVFASNTTRLAAVVHVLITEYLWPVKTSEKAVGTSDGRVAHVAEYFLPPEVVAQAMDQGAGDWVKGVEKARRERRKEAAEAKRQADAINKLSIARRKGPPLGQLGFFGGGF